MTNYATIPGIASNMSILAAMNAGLLPSNAIVASGFGSGQPCQTLMQLINAGILDASRPASSLTFATPFPNFGGSTG